jgi:hypothetical protein
VPPAALLPRSLLDLVAQGFEDPVFSVASLLLLPFAALVGGEQAVEQSNSVNFAMALRT